MAFAPAVFIQRHRAGCAGLEDAALGPFDHQIALAGAMGLGPRCLQVGAGFPVAVAHEGHRVRRPFRLVQTRRGERFNPTDDPLIAIAVATALAVEFGEVGGDPRVARGLVDIAMKGDGPRCFLGLDVAQDAFIDVAVGAIPTFRKIGRHVGVVPGRAEIPVERHRALGPLRPDVSQVAVGHIAARPLAEFLVAGGQAVIAGLGVDVAR